LEAFGATGQALIAVIAELGRRIDELGTEPVCLALAVLGIVTAAAGIVLVEVVPCHHRRQLQIAQ